MTLVELTMVVVIAGILSSVVIARLGSGFGRPGVRALARQLSLDLRHARGLAIARGTNHYAGFDTSGYTILRRDSPTDVAVETRRSIPDYVTVSVSAWDFEFEPTGAALGSYQCDLAHSGVTYRVKVILATGATTVEKL